MSGQRPEIPHDLVITLNRVRDWGEAERLAAERIRQYSRAGREPIEKSLRYVTSMEAATHTGRKTWTVVVRATV